LLGVAAGRSARADTPASAAPVPPTPAEQQYRRVTVDVASTRPNAVLERRTLTRDTMGAFLILPWRSSESDWETACVAPCVGALLDRYSAYRVAGANGISSSYAFTLPQGEDAIHLRIDAGSRLANRTGALLVGVGTAAMIVGVSLLIAATNVKNHDDEVRTRDAGWITGGVGVAAFGVGLPLLFLTRSTVYSGDRPLQQAESKPRFIGNGVVF
jgi:hypothetical protein